ncbi:MAG TPA: class I SAM-dependent methyltransferase [Blastocatellia bacterium]|nr:class I SAM-dependent methyltransferase [Blastocatellia bacterium]
MNIAEYAEMYKLESFYWWFVARRKLLESLMLAVTNEFTNPVILDVGCGTGMNFSVLSRFGDTFSSDSAGEALWFCKSRGLGGLVQSDGESLPFSSASFDVVTALDVLEHLDNDLDAMRELLRVTKENGVLVITVPAYGFLWSEHDEALHHRRRYAASELRNKLTNAGFEVERITYYITLLFFPILFLRFVQSVSKKSIQAKTSHMILPGWLNRFLIWILGFERQLLRWMNLPFGVSLVCLARKVGSDRGRHSAGSKIGSGRDLGKQPVTEPPPREQDQALSRRVHKTSS